jgi:hypothetical protein
MGHQHAWWPAVSLLAAVLLLAAGTCGAGEIRLGARLGGGFYGHDDVNDTIDDIARLYHEGGDDYAPCSFTTDDLKGGLVFGVNGEYLLNENWCVGAEFMPLSSDGGYGYNETYEDAYEYWHEEDDVDLEGKGNLLSAYAVYRIPMGDGPFVWRFGGGVDYVFGAKLTFDERYYVEYDYWGRPDRDDLIGANFEASGSALGFHGRAGVEYRVGDRFVLVADAALRFLKVDELEVDDVDMTVDGVSQEWPHMDEGETLKWTEADGWYYFNTEEGKKIGLDFSGLYLTVGAFYTF